MLEFPMPDLECRVALWRLHLEQLGLPLPPDFQSLAAVFLSGGLIRNAAQKVAIRYQLGKIREEELLSALVSSARCESAKMGSLMASWNRTIGFGHA